MEMEKYETANENALQDNPDDVCFPEIYKYNFEADKQAIIDANDFDEPLFLEDIMRDIKRFRVVLANVELPPVVILCDVLAQLIRENEYFGYDEIAKRYIDLFFEFLPKAEEAAGCNLRYFGINTEVGISQQKNEFEKR